MTTIFLADIQAYDPATGSEITYRYSTGSGYTNESGHWYAPRILQPARFSRSMGGTDIGGKYQVNYGELTLQNSDGALNGMADVFFDGRRLTLKHGNQADGFSDVLVAIIDSVSIQSDLVSLRLKDRSLNLDKPFAESKYLGNNALPAGTEGTADDLKDKYKPRLFGRVALMTPIVVNTSKLIYQVNDGAVDSISNVYDAGAYLSRGANYTNAADMQANAPGGGQYRCLESAGMFRLGSQPFGQISASVVEKWDYLSNTAAGLIQRILTEKGYTSSDWSASDFTTLNEKNAGSIGLLIEEGETTADIISRICQSVGAWWGFDALGIFRVARLDAPSGDPDLILTVPDTGFTEVASLSGEWELAACQVMEREPDSSPPVWQVTVKADQNLAVQDRKSLAGVVPEDRAVWFSMASRDQLKESSAVRDSRLTAITATYETLLNGISIAAAEAQRRLDLLSVRRDTVTITANDPQNAMSDVDLGSVVKLETSRLGYDSGRNMIVISKGVDYQTGTVDLVVWG